MNSDTWWKRAKSLTAIAAILLLPIAGVSAVAQPSSPATKPSAQSRFDAALVVSRMAVDFDGSRFSGPGYDWLARRGAEAQAFLLGEEHGIAENPKLAAQLFQSLAPTGYRHIFIETSPPVAVALDRAMRQGGETAYLAMLSAPESRVAFFGLKEEADWLLAARRANSGGKPMLFGLDYEVMADRYLIAQLFKRKKPEAAAKALSALEAASTASWQRHAETGNPQFIFSFSGDPELVRTVKRAWPEADADTQLILNTLEQTLAINALWVAGKGYESNLMRVGFMRDNLLRYWNATDTKQKPSKIFMKFGASHMVRGLSPTDVFDIGSLVPELVAQRGGSSFHLLVLAGKGSETANLNPATMRYDPGNRNQYGQGMEAFHNAALPKGFTLFDMAPMRSITRSSSRDLHPELVRVVHGFDAVLVMNGSTPSSGL
jgi:erythromycin esterase-like protein